MAERYMPEFPLGFVGAMGLTAAVSVVAFLLARSVGKEPLLFWWSARNWTPTKCKLVRLETDIGPLIYTYQFAGTTYESRRFSYSVTGVEDFMPGNVSKMLKAHPLGSEVACWVNPANPKEALLDRSLDPGVWFTLGAVALAVLMFVCALPMSKGLWHWLTYQPDPPVTWAEWFGTFYKNQAWMFTMGGLLFMIPGLIALKPLTLDPWLNWWRCQRWVETTCVVTKNSVRCASMGSGSRRSSTNVIEVEYEYDYGGRKHRGTRFSPWSTPGTDWLLQSSDSSKIKTMLQNLEVGGQKTCYVNPAAPDQAFLTRERNPYAYIGSAFGPVFLLMGWFVLLMRPKEL
jgi:hypothetical protein